MKKIYYVNIITVILLIFCSCKKAQLEVHYIDPGVEFSCAKTTDELKKYLNADSIETKEVPTKDWEYIIGNIKQTGIRKKEIREPWIMVKTPSFLFFLDQFQQCAYDENNDSIAISAKAIYLLLKHSDYYNKISREDLEYESGIKKFGIPDNYQFIFDKMSFLELRHYASRSITYHLQADD